jgi:plasmid maintenance system antidote protein VapI
VDLLRDAIDESGLSIYALAKDAQVDQSTLNKFARGERDDLTLSVAERLFEVLGLEVVSKARPRGHERS